jgi:hypothetical protein
MGKRYRDTLFLIAGAVLTALAMSALPSEGQAPAAFRAARSPHGDGKPQLNGIWFTNNSANWNLEGHDARQGPVASAAGFFSVRAGQSVVVGGEIPYQPWARAKQQENAKAWAAEDPEAKCFLPGVPRATYMPYDMQIIQSTDTIMIAYEYATAARRILLGDQIGAKIEAPFDTWMGWSRGRWDGDTLVVDVGGFNGLTWLDRAGNFTSEGAKVVERYTPTGPDHLMYEATIEDAKVFTRPWQIRFPLYRRKDANAQLLEYKCIEFVEEFMYGHLVKKSGT